MQPLPKVTLWLVVGAVLMAAQGAAQPSLYEQAAAEVKRGDFTPAVAVLQSILKTSPGDLRARNLLGIALVGLGRGDEAEAEFRKVLNADAKFVPALKNLAANEMRMGRREQAGGHFEAALKLAPNDRAVHLALAQIAFSQGRMQAAFEHYGGSGDLYLREPREVMNYAAAAMAVKQEAAALGAIRLIPVESDAGIHFEAGLMLAKLGRYEDAARQFELGRPGAADGYQVDFNLTLALLKARKYDAALAEAQKMIESGERAGEVYSLQAQAYEGLGQTKAAYETLRRATLLYPAEQASYLELIALCAEHENYELALEIAGIGLRVAPSSNRLHVQRGIVLAMMSRFEDAYTDLNAPEDARGWMARSLVLMRTGRVADAVKDLRRLKAGGADDYIVNWLLAEALVQTGDDSEGEAMAALKRSVALNPGVPQARLLLGKLLLAKGDGAGAVEQLEKAVALDPASVPAMYQLARALQKQGDKSRADELFARVGKQKTDGADEATRGGLLRIVREASH